LRSSTRFAVRSSLDQNVPMFDVRTQQAQIHRSVQQECVFAHVLTGFASLAVLLACVGIYGTLAYWVARRTPEIGLRMALGADRRHVARMVVREMAVPVVMGIVLGLGAALASTRVLESPVVRAHAA
jgi:ABC-type antimicrobial peptide transport system permease subunit